MLAIEDFGERLIKTGDLDPVYIMLYEGQKTELMSRAQLERWCLAYWCCYHVGVSSWIAEQPPERFFSALSDVASNGTRVFPRGTERRHFRGDNAFALVEGLELRYRNATEFIDYVSADTFQEVARRAQVHPGFGPWIAFKIADMLERVLGYPVDFTDCELGVYKEPLLGSIEACRIWGVDNDILLYGKRALAYAISRLNVYFRADLAPPSFNRFVNQQEMETILCKWKSHRNGHYPVGKDTHEIRHALHGWGNLAKRLEAYCPAEVAHAA